MIDQVLLDRVKPACARISRGKEFCGTGYLVGPDAQGRVLVATCHHVVSADPDAEYRCAFGDLGEAAHGARVLRFDASHDTALLALDGRPAGAEPLPLADPGFRPGSWYAHGYPAFATPLGVTLEGSLLDSRSVDREGRPAIALHSPFLAGRQPAQGGLGGFSGSPVLFDGQVLGHLFRVLGDATSERQANLGITYAAPAWAVRELLRLAQEGDVSGKVARPDLAAPPATTVASAARSVEAGAEVLARIHRGATPQQIREAAADGLPEQTLLIAAELLLGMSQPDDALALLEKASASDREKQLRALALSLRGDHVAAQGLLEQLPASAETAGLIGGVLKRRWLETGNPTWLSASYEAYRSRYQQQPDAAYLAVNVAALALYLGDEARSREAAAEATALVAAIDEAQRTHWEWATAAEARLLLGELEPARDLYRRAVGAAQGVVRDMAAMRRQARLDLERLGQRRHALDDVFPIGGVACVVAEPSGPGLSGGRLAAGRQVLRELVDARNALFAFGCGVRGADLLAAELVLDRGGTATAYLPRAPAPFLAEWVGERWKARFDRIGPQRQRVVPPEDPTHPFRECNEAAMRAALDQGRLLDEKPILVVVPPHAGSAGVRGVADAVTFWQENGGTDVKQLAPAVLGG